MGELIRSFSRYGRPPELLDDMTIESPKHRPSEQMMLEARARANAPRTITAWVCGDPPPGMSALDKRASRAHEG